MYEEKRPLYSKKKKEKRPFYGKKTDKNISTQKTTKKPKD